jgi:hypothetical protein
MSALCRKAVSAAALAIYMTLKMPRTRKSTAKKLKTKIASMKFIARFLHLLYFVMIKLTDLWW